jgi:hypothetical protein
MIQSLTSGHSRDKKLLQEAQQMLADSRVKIEFLKLRILKIKQNKQLRQQQRTGAGDTPSNGDTHQVKGEWVQHLLGGGKKGCSIGVSYIVAHVGSFECTLLHSLDNIFLRFFNFQLSILVGSFERTLLHSLDNIFLKFFNFQLRILVGSFEHTLLHSLGNIFLRFFNFQLRILMGSFECTLRHSTNYCLYKSLDRLSKDTPARHLSIPCNFMKPNLINSYIL